MAGKGDNPRKVDLETFRSNHDYIFGVSPSYAKCQCDEECQLRGAGAGKCWGQVTQYDEDEFSGGSHLCCAHSDYFAWHHIPYIPESPKPTKP